MSPGKKKGNSRWGYGKKREKFPEQQREIPRVTEILCTDFLMIEKKKEKNGGKKKQVEGSGLKS